LWLTEYVVPFSWVQKQFTKSFWENSVKNDGLEALKFPKVLGMRRLNEMWQGEDEGDTADEEGFMDEDGVVGPGNLDLGLEAKGRELHPFCAGSRERKWGNLGDEGVRKEKRWWK
jgi:hypothetical protein